MRLLIIEDEPKLAESLKMGLQEKGYAVDVAYTGTKELLMAEYQQDDVITLDILLPQINSLNFCQRLRKSRNNVPILMLTAKDTIDDLVTGLDSGADDYLTEPFAFRELLTRSACTPEVVRSLSSRIKQMSQSRQSLLLCKAKQRLPLNRHEPLLSRNILGHRSFLSLLKTKMVRSFTAFS
jgi:DNA-binding response OmpR family regulator